MALQDAWGYDGKTYSGQEFRLMCAAVTGGRGGASGAADYVATPQGVPNNTVQLAAGTMIIPADHAGDLGSYEVPNDAALTSPTFAATGANPRWDLLILEVLTGVPTLTVVQGTASGSPSYPSLAAHDNYQVICGVKMPASKSIIDNGANGVIEDRRSIWRSYFVCSSTTRPPIPFDGQMIEETDTERVLIWDAGNNQWAPSRLFIGAAASLPSAPIVGTPAYVTDTNLPAGSVVPSATARPVTPGLYVYAGATSKWNMPWNEPWGVMDLAQVVANSGTFSAETDVIVGHAVTFVANRRIRISVCIGGLLGSIAGDIFDFRIKEGATQYRRRASNAMIGGGVQHDGFTMFVTLTPAVGAHTYKCTGLRVSGTGTVNVIAAVTDPVEFVVEDLGPNGQPT